MKLSVLGCLLTALTVFMSFTLKAETLKGKVVRVVDGDTLTVLDETQTQHKVRLNKIDAPEKKQAYGEASKKHLSQYVFGKDVKVEFEKRDRYGRILGIVYLGALDVNLQMVKDGYAWHYKFFDKTTSYADAEKEAREKKLGLWVDPNPVEPYQFRKMKRAK